MQTARKTTKSKRLNFRISEAQDELLRRVATTKRQSVTAFIVESACTVARCELAEQTDFRLPPAQWEVFLAALDRPPAPTAALRRLLTEPSILEENLANS